MKKIIHATMRKMETDWSSNARRIIKKILVRSIPEGLNPRDVKEEKKIINVMLNDENIPRWGIAFTHRSVDPNTSSNYESYEIVGDRVLGLVFTEIVQYRYRLKGLEAEPGRVTELMSDIMGSGYQEHLCTRWYLDKLLLSNAPKVKKTNSDIFEAFFGMLLTIGNLIARGIGYAWSYNVLSMMLKDVELTTYEIHQPKVYINEVLTRYGVSGIKPIITQVTGGHEAHFELPEDLSVQLRLTERGPYIQKPTFGKAPETANSEAYAQLASLLREKGVVTRISSMTQNVWFVSPLDTLYQQALDKGTYADFLIDHYADVNGVYIQLIGVHSDGYKEVILGMNFDKQGVNTSKIAEVMNAYINM